MERKRRHDRIQARVRGKFTTKFKRNYGRASTSTSSSDTHTEIVSVADSEREEMSQGAESGELGEAEGAGDHAIHRYVPYRGVFFVELFCKCYFCT